MACVVLSFWVLSALAYPHVSCARAPCEARRRPRRRLRIRGRRPMEQKLATKLPTLEFAGPAVRPARGFAPGLTQAFALSRRVARSALARPSRRLRQFQKWRKSRFAPLLAVFGIFGPGLIAANSRHDAGAVATWSNVGAQLGF